MLVSTGPVNPWQTPFRGAAPVVQERPSWGAKRAHESHQLYFDDGVEGSRGVLRIVAFRAPKNCCSFTRQSSGPAPWVQLWTKVRSALPGSAIGSSSVGLLRGPDGTRSPASFDPYSPAIQKSPRPGVSWRRRCPSKASNIVVAT